MISFLKYLSKADPLLEKPKLIIHKEIFLKIILNSSNSQTNQNSNLIKFQDYDTSNINTAFNQKNNKSLITKDFNNNSNSYNNINTSNYFLSFKTEIISIIEDTKNDYLFNQVLHIFEILLEISSEYLGDNQIRQESSLIAIYHLIEFFISTIIVITKQSVSTNTVSDKKSDLGNPKIIIDDYYNNPILFKQIALICYETSIKLNKYDRLNNIIPIHNHSNQNKIYKFVFLKEYIKDNYKYIMNEKMYLKMYDYFGFDFHLNDVKNENYTNSK